MLAISPLRSNQDGNKREGNIITTMDSNFYLQSSSSTTTTTNEEFLDFSGVNLLESIDFDDLFMGMHNIDGLPDLEMDPELLAEFSLSSAGEEDSIDNNNNNIIINNNNNKDNFNNNVVSPNSIFDGCEIIENNINNDNNNNNNNNNEVCESYFKLENCDNNIMINKGGLNKRDNNEILLEDIEIQSKKKESGSESSTSLNSSSVAEKERGHKKHKSSSNSKIGANNNNNNNNNNSNSNQGKRKTKVDWTPELHRRFVQAVEQLGVDKAVPSRILELMGIDCLTRHNIASHLQKYRSHRKHLLAREAEAASWTQKRQMYGVAMGGGSAKCGGASISPWPHPPTIGFPPPPPPPPMATMHHPFNRPLHVWGHPSMDPQTRMPMWPKQVAPPPPPPTTAVPWTPHPPPPDPAFWHPSHHRRLPIPRSIASIPVSVPVPVPGIPPNTMYRPEHVLSPPTTQPGSVVPIDPHPSKESVDEALGDVLAKPWLPLPIGLKPPSMDSVFVELQRQGISKIPPSSSSSKTI